MVPGVAVKKREEDAPGHGVNDLVYAWERKGVFRAMLVEIHIVDTHSPFPIFLFYMGWVCQQFLVCDFSNKSCG
jgi:hypothetical protein